VGISIVHVISEADKCAEKRRESSHSSTLGRPANHSEKSSSVRKGSKDIGFIRKQNRKGLRFTATQRQVLTAEALATGGRASATRRTELAQDFEVAENTIEVAGSLTYYYTHGEANHP
jgi:hypothetical protein